MGRKKQSQENVTDILSSKKYSKSNALINSKGKAPLLAEKLFAIGIQQASEDEKGILTTRLRGTELKKLFGTNRGSFYQDVKDLVQPKSKAEPSLLDWRVIFTDDTTKKVEAINVIMDCTFENGVFEVRFNDKVSNQVKKLQANYTVFSLSETMPLKSIYSFKLYEILKSEYDKQEYLEKKNGTAVLNAVYSTDIHIIDLKLRVGVIDPSWSSEITEELKKVEPDYNMIEKIADEMSKNQPDKVRRAYNSYKRIDNFKKNVLERARTELEEKTSISFTYKNLSGGPGGKVYGFRFYISKKNDNVAEQEKEKKIQLTEDEALDRIFKVRVLLDSALFGIGDVKTITKAADYDVERVSAAYELFERNRTEIENPTAWMIKAIKENYQKPKKRNAKNSFNDFPQNETNFSELEDLILDN